jgi:hypothetical protein
MTEPSGDHPTRIATELNSRCAGAREGRSTGSISCRVLRFHRPAAFAIGIVGFVLLATCANSGDFGHPSGGLGTNVRTVPLAPAFGSQASSSSVTTPSVPGGGCLAENRAGTPSAGAGVLTPMPPDTTGTAPLYNSQLEPYAELTGPYGYVAAGAAIRNQGFGTVNLTWPGAPSTTNLVAAYMIWSIINFTVPPTYGTLNGVNVTGTWTAYTTPSPCWNPTYIYTFVADVTTNVVNGINQITDFPSGITNGSDPWAVPQTGPLDEGVSLIAIYTSGSPSLHQVTVYTGALTAEANSVTSQLNYSTTDSASATTTYLVADGQFPANSAGWNGTIIDSDAFPGSDSKASTAVWSHGNLSDTKTYNVTVEVGSNQTNATVEAGGDDCVTWIGQILSVQVPPSAPPYAVAFQEEGLPDGTEWNLTTHGATHSETVANSSSSIQLTLGNGSYSYSVPPIAGYTVVAIGTYQVDGGSVYLRVPFHQVLYSVIFSEAGLPSGTTWVVSLNDTFGYSNTTSIPYAEPNGTYPFVVTTIGSYTPSVASGSLQVEGTNVVEYVVFTSVTSPTFSVTFTESGLATLTNWSVTLNDFTESSTATSVLFTETNGSFNFTVDAIVGYAPNVTGGSVNVSGSAVTEQIAFTRSITTTPTFSVTFTESPLPNGAMWYVNISGQPGLSATVSGASGTSVATDLENGSYSYSAATTERDWTNPAGGSFIVSGVPLREPVAFSPPTPPGATYTVTFTESGLPSGATWYANLTGQSGLTGTVSGSTGTQLTISLPNGSYSYAASTNWKNWTTAGGSFSVAGSGKGLTVGFTAVGEPSTTPSKAPAAGFPWLWVVVGAIVAILLMIFFLVYRRRKKESERPSASVTDPSSPSNSKGP